MADDLVGTRYDTNANTDTSSAGRSVLKTADATVEPAVNNKPLNTNSLVSSQLNVVNAKDESDLDSISVDFAGTADNFNSDSETYYTPGRSAGGSQISAGDSTAAEFESIISSGGETSVSSTELDDDTLRESSVTRETSVNYQDELDLTHTTPIVSSTPLTSGSKLANQNHQVIKDEISSKHLNGKGERDAGLTILEDEGNSLSANDYTDNEDDGRGSWSDVEDNIDIDDMVCAKSFVQLLRDPNPILPQTVTELKSPDGSKVYLVGTAHFSLESQEDVAKTIRATQPDVVMVELCKGRVNILKLDENTILEEAKHMNFEKVRTAIQQSGVVQGVMYLLLLSMSAHLTKQLGMAPGGEFRRAFAEAKRVPGCLTHLGDRPIQITLQRALSALSTWQKIRLAWYMITSKEPISREEVERCKQKDLLEELLSEMTGEFPALSQVFVNERDIYLTHSLQLAVNSVSDSQNRQSSVFNPAVVVGVVGIGHVPGIVARWGKVSESDIPPLLKIPDATLSGKIFRFSFRASLVGLALYGCYRILPWQTVAGALPKLNYFQTPPRHSL